jgi:tRNA A-37 threonylcarbamoyl transferase component Bud32
MSSLKTQNEGVADISLVDLCYLECHLQNHDLITVPASTRTELHRRILEFCRHIAGTNQITAVGLCDISSLGVPTSKIAVEVVMVIHDFQPRLMSYAKVVKGRNVIVFAIDQWIFERDIERGLLGEASASMLIFPFVALVGKNYLHNQEVLLKKRLILELLENIVLSFPELSYVVRIKPEYFMYEVILNRVHVFPPLTYGMSHFLCDYSEKTEVERVLRGYWEALEQLKREGKISMSHGYVRIPKEFVVRCKDRKVRFANISKNATRALFSSLFGVFPQLLNFFSLNTEALMKFQKFIGKREAEAARHFVDPREYVYVPTANSLVSLADRVSVEAFASKMFPGIEKASIKVQSIGGFLNDVYLIRGHLKGTEKKVLVKRFRDWSGFKWFPLSLWSMGATTFAVSARSRLDRECAVNELLLSEGCDVPKVLHVSHEERLVFMEFIEGEDLSRSIKRIGMSQNNEEIEKELSKILKVGQIYAKVHDLNVALGDTKPENVIVNSKDQIYLLDFEQATRGGDKTWDVAEFLYYSGHYLPSHSERKAELIAEAFIGGYLKAGGEVSVVRKAGTSKYTRVFNVFTQQSVIRSMANVCQKGDALRRAQ